MNLLQHVLCTFISVNGDVNKFKAIIPYVLIPDAIRFYYRERKYSHFERSEDNKDVSWVEFPERFDNADLILQASKYLTSIRECAAGEITDITAFYEHNKHLPSHIMKGILWHLLQDKEFDSFINEIVDCSGKYENKFFINNKMGDEIEFRHWVDVFHKACCVTLATQIHRDYGIDINEVWLAENVFKPIKECYTPEMAENTIKYFEHKHVGPAGFYIPYKKCIECDERAIRKCKGYNIN